MATERMKTRYNIKATRHEFQESGKVWVVEPQFDVKVSQVAIQLGQSVHNPQKTERCHDLYKEITFFETEGYDRLAPYYGTN